MCMVDTGRFHRFLVSNLSGHVIEHKKRVFTFPAVMKNFGDGDGAGMLKGQLMFDTKGPSKECNYNCLPHVQSLIAQIAQLLAFTS